VREDEGTEKTKRRGWRITGWVVLVIAVYILLDSGLIPWGYVRSAPISGTIIDKETGQPIPHVVISIRWPQLIGTMGGTIHVGSGTIKRIEVVSDEQGNYLVPGWKRSKWEIGEGGFSKDRPEMHIYAAGYWPRTLRNKKAGRLGWGEAWKAEWDGEDIELEPMHWREWTKEEWEKNLRNEWDIYRNGKIHAWGSTMHLLPKGCEWKKTPKETVKIIQYNLKKVSMFPNIYSIVPRNKYPDDWDVCPDTKEVLLEHGLTENEWQTCCGYKTEKPESPHVRIMLERIKVMPGEQQTPLETENAETKSTTPVESGQKHGKGMAGK